MALTGPDGSMVGAANEGAITAAAVVAAALEQQKSVDMKPRTAPSDGAKRTTYATWFARPGWAQGGEFWQLELSAPQLRAVQRLPYGIALAAGGDRQVCEDEQAGPLLHIL